MFNFLRPIHARLAALEHGQREILRELKTLTQMEIIMSANTLDSILAQATTLNSLEASVKAIADGANAQVATLQGELAAAQAQPVLDQAKVDAISEQLSQATAVAQAMTAAVANTPAAAPVANPTPAASGS